MRYWRQAFFELSGDHVALDRSIRSGTDVAERTRFSICQGEEALFEPQQSSIAGRDREFREFDSFVDKSQQTHLD